MPPSNYTSDCFVTSERAYNEVLARCLPVGETTGAYVGVGPCQSFTYIGALRPRVAMIVDSRVDNLLEHLIFKLIFERADGPLPYLGLLFSREVPPDLADQATPESLVEAFDRCRRSGERFEENLDWIKSEALRRWPLTGEHRSRIDYLYTEFYRRQLDITSVNERARANLNEIPSLREVILARDSSGTNLHFLTDPERYAYVRRLQVADRVVPMLGNLTSPHTVHQVNQLLAGLGERVATLYISNLEEFLLERYTIEGDRIVRETNPEGLLDGVFASAYQNLLRSLERLDASDDALLIRFFFPGTFGGRSVGIFPHLQPDVRLLRNFLAEVRERKPRSVFETYL